MKAFRSSQTDGAERSHMGYLLKDNGIGVNGIGVHPTL